MSKEYTEDEVREKFLRHCNQLVKYWMVTDLSGPEFPEDKFKFRMEGLLHSILATIDGSTMALPGFILAPIPSDEDKPYYIEQGENWFPENHKIEDQVSCDIAGSLHELVNKFK